MIFSVIVPIYKVEKYLARCIESVLNQSFADFELILVDDGSPDNCPKICDEYAEKDGRIKVIHKENGGLVSARKAGIKIAKGEYVFNLDGDDALADGALENAWEIISKTNADMITFSYMEYKNGVAGEKKDDLADEGLYEKDGIAEKILPKILADENMLHMFYFIWGKAIKRSLVTKHQLNVGAGISLGEDLCCAAPCYMQAERVYVSRKTAYLYTIRDNSISTSFDTKQIVQIADVVCTLRKLEAEKPKDFESQLSRYSCFMCFAILAAAAEGGHFAELKEIKKLITELHGEEISKAEFKNITFKSRVAVNLIKKCRIYTAFYFLYLCKCIKGIMGKNR